MKRQQIYNLCKAHFKKDDVLWEKTMTEFLSDLRILDHSLWEAIVKMRIVKFILVPHWQEKKQLDGTKVQYISCHFCEWKYHDLYDPYKSKCGYCMISDMLDNYNFSQVQDQSTFKNCVMKDIDVKTIEFVVKVLQEKRRPL